MLELCKKLKSMVKDEEKGMEEYEELKSEMESQDLNCKDCVDTIEKIAKDEKEHRHDIKEIMKEIECNEKRKKNKRRV